MQSLVNSPLRGSLLLLLMLLLLGCGGTATPQTSPPDASATEPAPAPEADPEADPEPTDGTSQEDASSEGAEGELLVYSGRSEELVGPLMDLFEQQTGIEVAVRYGDTAEMAATILEEGANSPADLFFGQDAGAMGALAGEGRLRPLPADMLEQVGAAFRAPNGEWIGVTGRARVVVYNTEQLSEADLPASILDFTDPRWEGQIGWAPTNGSFQAFVTALRVTEGEEVAREWLLGVQANNPKVYANNNAIVEAVANGEISVGFVNHYYLARKLAEEGEGVTARNYFFPGGDIGSMVNVAGVGILNSATHTEAAEAFIRFLLSEEAQHYFRDETKEYPLVAGIPADSALPPLAEMTLPEMDLNALYDLAGTLTLLQELGIL